MFVKIKTFLTPPRRKAIYGVVTAGTVALLAFNVVGADQLDKAVQSAVSVLTALTTLMAFLHTGGGQ